MATRTRFDRAGRLDKSTKTPQGGLRIDANLTRTGIFLYYDEKGNEVREYRSPEEVFDAASLATLKLAPVTVGHPAMVRTDNYRDLAVGVVAENVRKADTFVSADVVVQDRATVDAITSGELVELSCGYEVDLDMTPGLTPDGLKYDGVQKNIRYNHVALGPANWGRAGVDVRLHLDAGGNSYSPAMTVKTDDNADKARADALKSDLEKVTGERDAFKADLDAMRVKLDESNAKFSKEKEKSENLIDPSKLDALVAARVSLESSARAILGDTFDAKGKSDREVMTAALAKHDAKFDAKDRSDEYIRARFDAATEHATKSDAAVAGLNQASGTAAGVGAGEQKSKIDEAQEAADKEATEAAKGGAPRGSHTRK